MACFAPNVRLFFSDEGLLLPAMAREVTRAPLRQLWDPIHGFEHWWSPLEALMGSSSVLQLWSAPPLVLAVYGLALLSAALMTAGRWTTVTTAATWALAEQLYRYDAMFANGGDLVMRAFLFLALFCRWGEAYSLDAWRRRRRELLGGAGQDAPAPVDTRLAPAAHDGSARAHLLPERVAQDRARLARRHCASTTP